MPSPDEDSCSSGDDFATDAADHHNPTEGNAKPSQPPAIVMKKQVDDDESVGDDGASETKEPSPIHADTSEPLDQPDSSADTTPVNAVAAEAPKQTSSRTRKKKNQALSFSMHSPRTPRQTAALPRSLSFTTARRRMHEVDGMPLPHWDRTNFETKRDETCRVVYEPKEGKEFFHKHLPMEDYQVMRSISLEQPYYSKYNRFFPKRGYFACKACGNALYSHETKFDAEDGWPAFGACVEGAVGVVPSEKRRAQIEQENQACIRLQAFVRGMLCRIRVTNMLEDMIQQLLREKEAKQQPTGMEPQLLKAPLFSPGTVKKKIGMAKGLNYTLLRALGDDYTEIHCHRCKSHLGDVMEEVNIGRERREFRERHRVNGRSLKYVEDDLPKRVKVESSLLFADPAQRRLLGLPSPKKKADTEIPLRSIPFVSPRTQRRQILSTNGIAADPLSVSYHSTLSSGAPRKNRTGFDSLSMTSHEPGKAGREADMLGKSFHEHSAFNNPGPRVGRTGGKVRASNLQEKRAVLEQFILSKSTH